ncbi:MAG: NifB/NifX family molybdenum-iron cluster-binding protein [Bacteroidales bacterium]
MKKIAVPLRSDMNIDDHFGHCEMYGIFTVSEDNKIVKFDTLDSTQGCGCKSGIAGDLADAGVTMMLAGGIGSGAINVLNHYGIEVIRGCSGNAKQVVEDYLSGNIMDSGESCHAHEDGHHHHHHE